MQHQYVDRETGRVINERLLGDPLIRLLYHRVREQSNTLFNMLVSARSSNILAALQFDQPIVNQETFLKRSGIDLSETMDCPESFTSARRLFERKIRYWECRPMSEDSTAIVSPADARVIPGSFSNTALIQIKDKFFCFEELFGDRFKHWRDQFVDGDFMVFRLTPDKYHYNHLPVTGRVVDFFTIDGGYHSCNPSAIISVVTPFSKNRRVVTILDTDIPGGSGVGLVAMVEVVALMIGDITQAYSENRYDNPQPIKIGMLLHKGQPKSLYQPGSSTDILIFQPGRISFEQDLIENRHRSDVSSRFSSGFGQPLVETDVKVRSLIARSLGKIDHV